MEERFLKLDQTFEKSKREKIYDEILLHVEDELPYIFLWHPKTYFILGKEWTMEEIFANGSYLSLLSLTKNK